MYINGENKLISIWFNKYLNFKYYYVILRLVLINRSKVIFRKFELIVCWFVSLNDWLIDLLIMNEWVNIVLKFLWCVCVCVCNVCGVVYFKFDSNVMEITLLYLNIL